MDMLSYFLGRLAGGGTGGSGGDNGPIYTDLVYNDDGSITLTDDEGQEHIMECEYVDGRLEKVKIDGNILDAVYEEDTDKLIRLGDINIEVGDYPSEIGNIEILIDDSGVLEDTEGSVTEKVGELIDKVAYELKSFECITNASTLFQDAKSFPSKAVVNLPNATTIYQAFSYWNKTPIPIVEEVIVNAPKVNRIDQMFHENHGVKKVILNASDNVNSMASIFIQNKRLEEVVLNFSTQNIGTYQRAFWGMFNTIKRIIGVLDFSSATNVSEMFSYCSHLEEVTFEPNTLSISMSLAHSSKLTAESVQSIIDGLKIVETAQTLTLHKDIVLTDEQKAIINSKGWTLAQ